MKIAIMHYHLQPGGVTGVIRTQAKSLMPDRRCLVLTGAPVPDQWKNIAVHVPEIGYDSRQTAEIKAKEAAMAIKKAIYSRWPEGCDLLHIHNPLLAKNKNFLEIINLIQQENIPLLLQIHDFAEDGRPNAYYAKQAYPADCHYCVINSRDYRILKSAGLSPNGLHVLPNCVDPAAFA